MGMNLVHSLVQIIVSVVGLVIPVLYEDARKVQESLGAISKLYWRICPTQLVSQMFLRFRVIYSA